LLPNGYTVNLNAFQVCGTGGKESVDSEGKIIGDTDTSRMPENSFEAAMARASLASRALRPWCRNRRCGWRGSWMRAVVADARDELDLPRWHYS